MKCEGTCICFERRFISTYYKISFSRPFTIDPEHHGKERTWTYVSQKEYCQKNTEKRASRTICKLNLQVIPTVCYILQENFKFYQNKLKMWISNPHKALWRMLGHKEFHRKMTTNIFFWHYSVFIETRGCLFNKLISQWL